MTWRKAMDSGVEEEAGDGLENIDKVDDVEITRGDEEKYKPDEETCGIGPGNGAVMEVDDSTKQTKGVENRDEGKHGMIEDASNNGDGDEGDGENHGHEITDGDEVAENDVGGRGDTEGADEPRQDGEENGQHVQDGINQIDDRKETATTSDGVLDEAVAKKSGAHEGENIQQGVVAKGESGAHDDNDGSGGGEGGKEGTGRDREEYRGYQGIEGNKVKVGDEDAVPGDSANVTTRTHVAVDAGTSDSGKGVDDVSVNDSASRENFKEHGEETDMPKPISKSSSGKKSGVSKKSKTVRVRSSKTVSSIEVDMSRIMRSTRGDLDSEDDEAVTRVTCTKSVDFSLPVDDEVEEEIQRVIERPGSGRTSIIDEEALAVGRAATMNTPVTNDDHESYMYARSIRTPSRDGIYEHALNLINNRCRVPSVYSARSQPQVQRRRKSDPPPRSAASLPAALIGGVPMFDLPNVVQNINEDPFATQPNSFFYVAQNRPLPMKPLKVWKGYRGNVYFEPMVCRKVHMLPQTSSQDESPRSVQTSRFPSILKSDRTRGADVTSSSGAPKSATTTARSQTATTTTARDKMTRGTKSALSMRSGNARQLSILDKSSVLDRMDYNTAEDIQWISGIESTGTLQIGPSNVGLTGRAYSFYRNGDKHPKLRIRRGLVSHELATNSKHAPKLGVRGGHINEDGSVVVPQRKALQSTRDQTFGRGSGAGQDHKNVNPNDTYSCVDPMTALREIMNRNDGHGRSKLVHILPSASYNDNQHASPMLREKGK